MLALFFTFIGNVREIFLQSIEGRFSRSLRYRRRTIFYIFHCFRNHLKSPRLPHCPNLRHRKKYIKIYVEFLSVWCRPSRGHQSAMLHRLAHWLLRLCVSNCWLYWCHSKITQRSRSLTGNENVQIIFSHIFVNVNVNREFSAWLKQPKLLQSPRECCTKI